MKSNLISLTTVLVFSAGTSALAGGQMARTTSALPKIVIGSPIQAQVKTQHDQGLAGAGIATRPGSLIRSQADIRNMQDARAAAEALGSSVAREDFAASSADELKNANRGSERRMGSFPTSPATTPPADTGSSLLPALPRNNTRGTLVQAGDPHAALAGIAQQGGTEPSPYADQGKVVAQEHVKGNDGSWSTTTLYESGYTVYESVERFADGGSLRTVHEHDVATGMEIRYQDYKDREGRLIQFSQDPNAQASGGNPCNPLTGVCPEGKRTNANLTNPGSADAAGATRIARGTVSAKKLGINPVINPPLEADHKDGSPMTRAPRSPDQVNPGPVDPDGD